MHVQAEKPVAPVAPVAAPAAPLVTGPGPIPAYGSDAVNVSHGAAPVAKTESAGAWDKVKAWWKDVYRSDENIAAWKSFESDMEKRPHAYIQPNEKGPKVTQFQEKLRALGVNTNVNGVYGPETQGLVRDIKGQLGIDDGYLDADGNPVRSAVVTPLLQSKINALLGQKQGQSAPVAGPAAPAGPVAETVTPEEEAEWAAAKEKMTKFGYKPGGDELKRLQDIERRINARAQAEAQVIAAAKQKIEAMLAADGPVSLEELKTVEPYIVGLQAGTVQQEPLLDKLVVRLQERAQKHGVTPEAAAAAQPEGPKAPPAEEIPDVPVVPYTIKAGDTKQSIASAHGVTLEALKAANPNTRWVPGATVKIPVAEIPDEAPVPSKPSAPPAESYPEPVPMPAPASNLPPPPATAGQPASALGQLTFGQMKDNMDWALAIMTHNQANPNAAIPADMSKSYDAVRAKWEVLEKFLTQQPDLTKGQVQPAKPAPALAGASFDQVLASPIGQFAEAMDWAVYTQKHRILAGASDVTPQERAAAENTLKNVEYLRFAFSNGQKGSAPPGGVSSSPTASPLGTVKIKKNLQDPRVQILVALFEKKKAGQPLSDADHLLYESTMKHYMAAQ